MADEHVFAVEKKHNDGNGLLMLWRSAGCDGVRIGIQVFFDDTQGIGDDALKELGTVDGSNACWDASGATRVRTVGGESPLLRRALENRHGHGLVEREPLAGTWCRVGLKSFVGWLGRCFLGVRHDD